MEIVAAVSIAILISLIFFYALSARGPWGSLWSFFLIILLLVWGASLWVSPVGPVYWGVAWAPLIFIAIVVAVLLAAIPTSGSHPKKRRGDVGDPGFGTGTASDEEKAAAGAVGFMFWVLIGLLIVGIVAGYVTSGTVMTY